jgi:predicted nucleic acid-binding protein
MQTQTILVDTSVWISFFAKNRTSSDQNNKKTIEHLLTNGLVGTIFPIRAEVLAGNMQNYDRLTIAHAFDSMVNLNLDWNSRVIWDEIIELAHIARKVKVSLPGIIDRMILLASIKNGIPLWTADQKLLKFAKASAALVFEPN